jgi:hypothetical protein
MKKIIILGPPGCFSKRDYERLGIGFLKKNFSVKFLDFTPWIFPNFWKKVSNELYKCEEHIIISCKQDFLSFNLETDPVIVVDLVEKNIKTNWVREQLKKRNSLFVALDVNPIPGIKTNSKRVLVDLIAEPKRFFRKLFKFFVNKYYSLINTYHPDILVLGGLAALKKSKVENKIFAHSLDYDIYLDIKNKPTSNKNSYAVFLDVDIINHPDTIILNLGSSVTEFQYYPILIKFLKKFETDTGLQIKFAIHPKSRNKNLRNLLEGIPCYEENTAELVRNSSAVLLHASTAISYAVLFKKPTIFLTSNKLKNTWIGPRIENLAKIVNAKVLNMNDDLNKPLNSKDLLKIDEEKYKNYVDQYLKVPNSPDIPLWKIFLDFIKKNNSKNIINNL